jgi:hypothetical protein
MTHGDALRTLASHRGWPSISIYLHTHRTVTEKEQDRIRLKNLLRSACDELVSGGMAQPEATAACAPASELLEDDAFWREGTEGLALFVADGAVEIIKLDTQVPEQSVVGDRFYLRPLFAAHQGERRFHALALDKNGCRLFRGDGATIDQIPLEGVPVSLADELKYDQREESLQMSTFAGPQATAGAGRSQGMFHGHGGEKDVEKTDLERYLRKVERAVTKIACEDSTPLVLLGVEYEIAVYRALSTCRTLIDEHVTGATDEMPIHQIHALSLAALEPHFSAQSHAAVAQVDDKSGSAVVTRDPAQIVEAAVAGRVRILLLDDGIGPFGTFDREAFTADIVCADAPRMLRESPASAESSGACGWDLVDLAAAETLLQGGEVFAFSGEDSPVSGVAALLRY